MTGKIPSVIASVALLAVSCGGPDATEGEGGDILIGALSDLAGPTSDVGVPYEEGRSDYVDWLNSKGGIDGRKIILKNNDSANDVAKAEQFYSQYVAEGAVAIQGWATGETEALRQKITQDELPFFSGSLSEHLANPKDTPYNFLMLPTYSTQMRIALQWIAKDADGPTEVAVFHNDSPFGTSPLPAGKDYIKQKGLKIGYRAYPMPSGVTDFNAQLTRARGADYIIVQNVSTPASVLAKNVRQQEFDAEIVCLNWCSDEGFLKLAGPAAENVTMIQPIAPPAVSVPGHDEPRNYLESKGKKLTDLHYVQGWYTMHVMTEGIRKVIEDGNEVTGANIKKALETMGPVDTGNVTCTPVKFTTDNHEGVPCSNLYTVNGGKMTLLEEAARP